MGLAMPDRAPPYFSESSCERDPSQMPHLWSRLQEGRWENLGEWKLYLRRKSCDTRDGCELQHKDVLDPLKHALGQDLWVQLLPKSHGKLLLRHGHLKSGTHWECDVNASTGDVKCGTFVDAQGHIFLNHARHDVTGERYLSLDGVINDECLRLSARYTSDTQPVARAPGLKWWYWEEMVVYLKLSQN